MLFRDTLMNRRWNMPVSHRHKRAAAKAAPKAPATAPYVIVDPHHKPDLRGELAGAKVKRHGTDQIVHLTEKQAKFYLDSGSLRPFTPSGE
jgi:hypothetical protein